MLIQKPLGFSEVSRSMLGKISRERLAKKLKALDEDDWTLVREPFSLSKNQLCTYNKIRAIQDLRWHIRPNKY